MQFFPASMPKGRLPDRTYFFNILNTISEQYMQAIIRHAAEQRNTGNAEAGASGGAALVGDDVPRLAASPRARALAIDCIEVAMHPWDTKSLAPDGVHTAVPRTAGGARDA